MLVSRRKHEALIRRVLIVFVYSVHDYTTLDHASRLLTQSTSSFTNVKCDICCCCCCWRVTIECELGRV